MDNGIETRVDVNLEWKGATDTDNIADIGTALDAGVDKDMYVGVCMQQSVNPSCRASLPPSLPLSTHSSMCTHTDTVHTRMHAGMQACNMDICIYKHAHTHMYVSIYIYIYIYMECVLHVRAWSGGLRHDTLCLCKEMRQKAGNTLNSVPKAPEVLASANGVPAENKSWWMGFSPPGGGEQLRILWYLGLP